MDFKESVKNELDSKYLDMLNEKTEAPIKDNPVKDYDTFERNHSSYNQRKKNEKDGFNNSLNKIIETRNARLAKERADAQAKAEKKAFTIFGLIRASKVATFLLPGIFGILAIIDQALHFKKYDQNTGMLGSTIFFAVAFSAGAFFLGITFIRSMTKYEKFKYGAKLNTEVKSHNQKGDKINMTARTSLFSAVIFIIIFMQLCFAFSWGLKEGNRIEDQIDNLPAVSVDYEANATAIEETYENYKDLDLWKRAFVKNKKKLKSLVAGYNEFRAEQAKEAMEAVTPENAHETLLTAGEYYGNLNKKQLKELSWKEKRKYKKIYEAYEVVKAIAEIDSNIVDNYVNLNATVDKYSDLDKDQKEYVYNYDLVPGFNERYEYISQFEFEEITQTSYDYDKHDYYTRVTGYKISVKEGTTLSGEIIIPDIYKEAPVVTIKDNAFENQTGITKLTVPSSVTTIGAGAFKGCNSIEEITLPFVGKSTDATGTSAVFGYIFGFEIQQGSYSCYSSEVNNNLLHTKYGNVENAVWQYTYQANRSTRHSYYYYIPSSIKNVTITQQTKVSTAAFMGCTELTSINYEKGVTSLSESSFYGCTNLSSFNTTEPYTFDLTRISDTITNRAFFGCSSVKYILFNENIKTIGDAAFSKCSSVVEIQLPQSLQKIGDVSFAYLSLIKEVNVPNNVQSIGYGAFKGCNSLEKMTLPFVGQNANATDIKSVFGFIFDYTYQTSDKLSHQSTSTSFVNSKYGEGVDGATWQYTNRAGNYYYYSYYYYIPTSLRKITITNQTTVPIAAFNGCSNLTDITFTKKLTAIGDYAFQNCTNLSSFNSNNPNTLRTNCTGPIGKYAFYKCAEIENLSINENVTSIGAYAFSYMSKVKSVVVPSSVTYIDVGAFKGFDSLEEITLPFVGYSRTVKNVSAVFGYIFGYNSQTSDELSYQSTSASFVNTQYGEGVDGAIWQYTNRAGNYYYYSYYYYIPTSLKKVTITDQNVIPVAAFNGCTMLTSIVFEKGITETGSYAFQNCTATVE